MTTSVLFILSNVNNASTFCNRDIIFLSFSFFGFSIPWTSHSPDIIQTWGQQVVIRNEYNQSTFCIATHLGSYWISKLATCGLLCSNTQAWPPTGNGTTTWCTRVAKINVLWLITTTMCKPANKGGVLYSQKHSHCRDSPHKYKDMCITQVQSYSLLHITMHFTGITVYRKGLFTSILFINVLCFFSPPNKNFTLPLYIWIIYLDINSIE